MQRAGLTWWVDAAGHVSRHSNYTDSSSCSYTRSEIVLARTVSILSLSTPELTYSDSPVAFRLLVGLLKLTRSDLKDPSYVSQQRPQLISSPSKCRWLNEHERWINAVILATCSLLSAFPTFEEKWSAYIYSKKTFWISIYHESPKILLCWEDLQAILWAVTCFNQC